MYASTSRLTQAVFFTVIMMIACPTQLTVKGQTQQSKPNSEEVLTNEKVLEMVKGGQRTAGQLKQLRGEQFALREEAADNDGRIIDHCYSH